MSSAQLLLRRVLDQAGGDHESGYVLVIDGEGLEHLPDEFATPKAKYRVARAATEVGLRHLLWKANGAPLIVVMPPTLAQQIQKSPDILRCARNERVHSLSVNDVLEVLLGVRVVGADTEQIQKLALEHVDRLSLRMSRRTLPTVIDRQLLTELLVDVSVGEHVRRSSAAQLLAAWLRDPPQWSDGVSALVREAVPRMHGEEGSILAWALEQPAQRLREVIVHGAVLTVDGDELPKQVWGPLWKAAAEPPLGMDRRVLRRHIVRLVEDTLSELGDLAGPLLDAADTLARSGLLPAQSETSPVLPLAFTTRCHSLITRAAKGETVSSTDVAWLAAHRAAPLHRETLAVVESLARLTRYLAQPEVTPTELVDKVIDYQRNGSFADLAIQQMRAAMAASPGYHAEVNKVIAACRERRDRANRSFAEQLAAGYEACLHRDGITPLHRVWKRTVAPLWQSKPDAQLFLVVLDGCSYPVFLQLLYDLAQRGNDPLGLSPDADGRVVGLPALSPLPTVTSHARGAIFLGELPSDPLVAETVFRDEDEAKTDPARLKQNATLGTRSRRLFLKGNLADGGESLLAAVRSDEVDVVAVVFNAVDDQIGSSNTGAAVRIAASDIVGFEPALRAALDAGRRVLLTADHGHSPWIDKALRAGAGKTPRYVALGKGDVVPEGFLEIDIAGLGGPPQRRAFAWRSGAYLGAPQAGFHGGCSLEEMVVPLAWIERKGLPCDEPTWWYGRDAFVPQQVVKVPPPLVTPLPSEAPAPARPQLSLFDPARKAAMLPLSAAFLEQLSADEKAVLVLLRDNKTARASELAELLKKNAGRFNGLMVALRRKLHAAGSVLFVHELLPSGETMYRYTGKESS